MIEKEVVMAYFEVLFWNLRGGIEEDHSWFPGRDLRPGLAELEARVLPTLLHLIMWCQHGTPQSKKLNPDSRNKCECVHTPLPPFTVCPAYFYIMKYKSIFCELVKQILIA
jgi:hypothetical protein